MRYIVEHQHLAIGGDAIIAKAQRHASIFAIINSNFIAMEQQAIFFTGKIFAPKTFFGAHNEIGVVVAFFPRERRRRVERDSFSAESDLSRFEHNPEDHVAERSRQRGANTGSHARICLHQSWNNNAASNARDCSADCHTVRNNEMLKIDKRSDDQERNENPVRNPQLPGEPLPHRKEKKCGKEFHREIAERNFCTAICASTAKREPTDQWKIVMPLNRLVALRAKRPTRPIDGEIDRPTVDANIQKRADHRAEHEGKRAKEKVLSRMLHAISWRSVSTRGAPSTMQSRCSFRIADTSAAPWRLTSEYQA